MMKHTAQETMDHAIEALKDIATYGQDGMARYNAAMALLDIATRLPDAPAGEDK